MSKKKIISEEESNLETKAQKKWRENNQNEKKKTGEMKLKAERHGIKLISIEIESYQRGRKIAKRKKARNQK